MRPTLRSVLITAAAAIGLAPLAWADALADAHGPYTFGLDGNLGGRVREAVQMRTRAPEDHTTIGLLNEDQSLHLPQGNDKTAFTKTTNAVYADGAFDVEPRGALGFYVLHGQSSERARTINYRQRVSATRAALQGAWLNDRRLALGLELATTTAAASQHLGTNGNAASFNYQSWAVSAALMPSPQQTVIFAYHPGVHRLTAGGSMEEIGRAEIQYAWRGDGPLSAHAALRQHFNRQARASLYNDSFSWQMAGQWRANAKNAFETALDMAPAFARDKREVSVHSAGDNTLSLTAKHLVQDDTSLEGTLRLGKPQLSSADGLSRHLAIGVRHMW